MRDERQGFSVSSTQSDDSWDKAPIRGCFEVQPVKRTPLRPTLAILGLCAGTTLADAATPRFVSVPLPRPRPALAIAQPVAPVPLPLAQPLTTAAIPPRPTAAPAQPQAPLAAATSGVTSAEDLAVIRRAVDFAKKDKPADAAALARSVADPVGRKLIEWVTLRIEDDDFDFARYASFIAANPGWASIPMFRRKAEAALWQNDVSADTVRRFFATSKPVSGKGRLAYARALLAAGDRAAAQAYVREAWRNDAMSAEMEKQALEEFGALLNGGDHTARMEQRLYAEDDDGGLRAAQRLGPTQVAIAKARIAVSDKSAKAKALLDAVPDNAQRDPGYMFAKIQWLRRNDKIAEAAQLLIAAPTDPAVIQDPDEWWTERRLVARELLDAGDAQTAYKVARNAAEPVKSNPRVEHHFTAGWIALRFLNNPALAQPHFVQIEKSDTHPTSLARGAYWLGRTAEAAGRPEEARAHYQRGARYPAAYYGQLARAKLGLPDIVLAPAPNPGPEARASLARLEIVRAANILYAIGERDLVVSMMADLGDRLTDVNALAALAETAQRNQDARGLLMIGKGALARGLPFDIHAFPTAGLPRYTPVGVQVEPALAYSIARQESAFNPRAISSANALGLMQVTPAAGKHIAKRNGIAFDQKRLLNDPAYNVQLGAAELGDALEAYRGSYILTFVGYNAGRGRVRQWVERYGDPRDPDVDPVDWVERIPFSETRNYVQRVLENLQVYRLRFGGSPKLLIEADLRRGAPTGN
jgi:soluble lytic murein transglycosylase